MWEYPHETPDGDQVEIVEVMNIVGGLIKHHRIYWGWKGCSLITPKFAAARRLTTCRSSRNAF
jgi:hypothetical protein